MYVNIEELGMRLEAIPDSSSAHDLSLHCFLHVQGMTAKSQVNEAKSTMYTLIQECIKGMYIIYCFLLWVCVGVSQSCDWIIFYIYTGIMYIYLYALYASELE